LDDIIDGAAGDDTLNGGSGNDTATGGTGADAITGGTGIDLIIVNAAVGSASDSTRVTVSGVGNDTGQDTITGFDLSNETLKIVATNVSSFVHGTDTAIGTAGAVNDGTVGSFTSLTGLVELNQATNNDWDDTGDIAVTFASPTGVFNEANFEARLQYTVTGTSSANTITTGALDDIIDGAAGDDTLSGGSGNDMITGGAGADALTGGSGADMFIVRSGQSQGTISGGSVG
jgi:Ca2+-binding RTX toxin-like protein